jgi:hypothetical protein
VIGFNLIEIYAPAGIALMMLLLLADVILIVLAA